MKSIFFTLTRGPSSRLKVRLTSFGPPATSLIVWVTRANSYPFSENMPRMMPSTRRMRAGSMNESSRIATLSSRSFSSIFDCSIFLDPV